MSVQAYQTSLSRAENPRQTEYRLLGQVTQALMEAQGFDKYEFSRLAKVLDWNRRVWSAFATDCAMESNNLPDSLRAGIISLSIFVSKHSGAVLRSGAEIDPLIDINKMIMQGLEQSAANAAAAQHSAA